MVDHPIDPHWIPVTGSSQEAVVEIINRLQNYERYYEHRQRARRAADQEHFERSITAIICDVIQRHLTDRHDWVRVSLSHRHLDTRSRYKPFSFGQTLPHNLRLLEAEEMGFIEKRLGGRREEVGPDGEVVRFAQMTTIRPGPTLLRWIGERSLTRADFGRLENEEVIILKAEKDWHGDRGRWLEYDDYEETNQFRDQMQTINRRLQEADISYAGPQPVDLSVRRLKRFFSNGQFNQGGRLFGGFWQQLSSEFRQRHIRIDGEQISELDYGQIALRILYGIAGEEPGLEDLYAIPAYEPFRDGIKLVINAALFTDRAQSRMPQNARPLFGRGPRYSHVLAAIQQAHAPIADYFFTGIGLNLMYRESEILIDVLLGAMELGIIALPIHDSVLVPRSRADETNDLMLRAFKEHTGIRGVVSKSDR
jgi:hypothetical protein